MNKNRKNGQIVNFRRKMEEQFVRKGFVFETFWANSSGGFEGPQTFFNKKTFFFHFFSSLSLFIFYFIFSLLFHLLSCLFLHLFSSLSFSLSPFSSLVSCLLSLVSCLLSLVSCLLSLVFTVTFAFPCSVSLTPRPVLSVFVTQVRCAI